MNVSINPSDSRPIYVQIVDEIRRGLVVGTLRAGDALPSVRQLATEVRVNPNTVQQAYRELERAGIAEARRGQGTFITAHALKPGSRERGRLVRAVAERALQDAYRHGLDPSELVEAITRAAGKTRATKPRRPAEHAG